MSLPTDKKEAYMSSIAKFCRSSSRTSPSVSESEAIGVGLYLKELKRVLIHSE